MLAQTWHNLKRKNCNSFNGFTLAEVLITLVVIGIIAAMTVPTLMNNTNKQEIVSSLKKSYSTLAQATESINTDCIALQIRLLITMTQQVDKRLLHCICVN